MAEHCSSKPCTGPHLSLQPVPRPLLPSPGQLQAHLRLLLQHQQALVTLLQSKGAEWSWHSVLLPRPASQDGAPAFSAVHEVL